MLDSLVRVSRRVGWVTDLLAASLQPPTGPASPAEDSVRPTTPEGCERDDGFHLRHSDPRPKRRRRQGPDGPSDTSAGWRTTGETANNRRRAQDTPAATCHYPPLRSSRLHYPAGCGVLRTRDKCVGCDGAPCDRTAPARGSPARFPICTTATPDWILSPQDFEGPPVYLWAVSRTLELSLQSSLQLSLTVLVCYRSHGGI